ncbi:MAG: AAA family ATPase, partial [Candidatus Competibacteraceae bacterium]|nr:AAA family ATPase [Candidatus Competibacteraceae bacterium]
MSEISPAAAVNPLSSAELQWAGDFLQALRREIGQVLIGQQAVVDQVLIALGAAGHVLVEGVPGL